MASASRRVVGAIAGLSLAGLGVVPGVAPAAGVRPQRPPSGSWRPASFRVGGRSPVLTGTRSAGGFSAYVVWVDTSHTRLALYPGTQEPAAASPRGPAEVPPAQRRRLLATFNGGFKSAAGAGGFVVNGRVDAPLRDGLATLVEYRNGTLAILDWQGRTSARSLVLARQNLSPLVWNGKPSRVVGEVWRWGATLGGGAAVWRSAVGITRQGDLVYAAAGGQTPASLATLMVRLGAVRALELDINPEWPTFIAYGARGGRSPAMLVPNPQQSSDRYLHPDARDFFAVYTRAGGGPFVPFG